MTSKLLLAFVVGSTAGLIAGCQAYDFEPVVPLAISQQTQPQELYGRRLKPNLMFLIDKSGSMNFAANDAIAPCTPGCNQSGQPACPAGCRTRLGELKSAMGTFLSTGGNLAWMGMAVFPTAVAGSNGVVDACGATSSADIRVQLAPTQTDVPDELIATANAVNMQIQTLNVGGGTPTGDSLKFLGDYAPLADPDPKAAREDFIVLLTDGLPNCNSNNVNSCTGTSCRCTLVPATSCVPASFCTQGCLDKDNSAAQVTALRKKNIRTIVIGFGADTASGDGPDTLNEMAENGGFARKCENGTDAECGANNTCDTATRLCSRKFYQATSAAELATVLADIGKAINPTTVCTVALTEIPRDPSLLAVIVDGKHEDPSPTTWIYSAGEVTFTGLLCDRIKQSTSAAPVEVVFRIVNAL
jgi:hypothetical protein